MSDIDFGTPPDPGPESEPAPAAAPASDDLFANPLEDQAVVSRGFAENLRAEGLKYRTELREREAALKAYEDIYGVYDEGSRNTWFDLARTWANNPAAAAQQMQEIAQRVLADEQAEASGNMPADIPAEEPTDAGGMLSPERVQEMINEALAQRDKLATEDRMVTQALTELRAEGIDPDGMEGMMVLWTAANKTVGDIKAAAQELRDYQQSIIDKYVQGRATGAQPSPTSTNGVPATGLPQVGGWDDIRRSAAKFMESAGNNQG